MVADRECEDIAASLVHEIEAVGAPYKLFILEDVASGRSAIWRRLPPTWSRARSASSPCTCSRNELRSRMQLTDIVNRRRMRHGHMVNINRQMMLEGMRADFPQGRSPARK